MYDSRPKEREGEPIESVVSEAIDTTASKSRAGMPTEQRSLLTNLPHSRRAFAIAAAVALIEALVILAIFAIYVI